ncbi:MAG TPA: hypothetical protein VM238_21480 [Phycisphaerae bacterium]|nr:hypothetical protein [Phycisphaerae bacterium]
MLASKRRGQKWIGLVSLALALTLMVGCGAQGTHTRTASTAGQQPILSLAAGDGLGQAVFGGGEAEVILAAREAAKTDTQVAVAE